MITSRKRQIHRLPKKKKNLLETSIHDKNNIVPVPGDNVVQQDVQNMSGVVCSPVENLPIRTPVPVVKQVSNLMSTSASIGTGTETTAMPTTENYNSIIEEDTIVQSPVGFFFDMEPDEKSFSDDISKSSMDSNNATSTLV